jgi:hypothetical protein
MAGCGATFHTDSKRIGNYRNGRIGLEGKRRGLKIETGEEKFGEMVGGAVGSREKNEEKSSVPTLIAGQAFATQPLPPSAARARAIP